MSSGATARAPAIACTASSPARVLFRCTTCNWNPPITTASTTASSGRIVAAAPIATPMPAAQAIPRARDAARSHSTSIARVAVARNSTGTWLRYVPAIMSTFGVTAKSAAIVRPGSSPNATRVKCENSAAARPARSGFTRNGAPASTPRARTAGPPIGKCEYQRPVSITLSIAKNSGCGSAGSDSHPFASIFACQSSATSSDVLAPLSNARTTNTRLSAVATPPTSTANAIGGGPTSRRATRAGMSRTIGTGSLAARIATIRAVPPPKIQ